jgi:hypothetical protein
VTRITYCVTPRGEYFARYIQCAVEAMGAVTVCDLGGGANPLLSQEFIQSRNLRYVLMDVSEKQLALAPDSYEKVAVNLTAPDFQPPVRCDVAFSNYVLEHIRDPRQFHVNVRALMNPGGRAIHFFPTLYSLPFVVNRLLPQGVSGRFLPIFLPGREPEGRHGKFPAYYRWCRGPTGRQIDRLRHTGFEVEKYVGFFGHSYFRRLAPLQVAEWWLADVLTRHPLPSLTSFAQVTLRAPDVD